MFKVGEVVRPYQALSAHVVNPAIAAAQTRPHVAAAVAAPSPSANDVPCVNLVHAQLRSIGRNITPTNGHPVPNTHTMATRI